MELQSASVREAASLPGVLIVPTRSASTAGIDTLNVDLNWQLVSVYNVTIKPVRRAPALARKKAVSDRIVVN